MGKSHCWPVFCPTTHTNTCGHRHRHRDTHTHPSDRESTQTSRAATQRVWSDSTRVVSLLSQVVGSTTPRPCHAIPHHHHTHRRSPLHRTRTHARTHTPRTRTPTPTRNPHDTPTPPHTHPHPHCTHRAHPTPARTRFVVAMPPGLTRGDALSAARMRACSASEAGSNKLALGGGVRVVVGSVVKQGGGGHAAACVRVS